MKVFRVEHSVIREKNKFFVGPWSQKGWKDFPCQQTAFETILHMGEAIADWGMVRWEGARVSEFSIRSGFNQKYLAGVEKEEDLSFLDDWWDFLRSAGFVISTYEVNPDYVLVARDFDQGLINAMGLWKEVRNGELGRPNQVAFHWFHARLISRK